MKINELTEVIGKRNALDFGSLFSDSFELFKKVWLHGFFIVLLSILFVLLSAFIINIPLFLSGVGISVLAQEVGGPEMFQGLSEEGLGIIMIVIFGLLTLVILVFMIMNTVALMAGFYRVCKQNDVEDFGSDVGYFYYFKGQFFGKLFVLALLMMAVVIAGMLVCGIGLIYVSVPLALIPVIFAFNTELSPVDIVKGAFALGNKNWLVLFGVTLVMGFVAELGLIACFVGIFFTAMLSKIPIYFAYKNGVGFTETKEDIYLEEH